MAKTDPPKLSEPQSESAHRGAQLSSIDKVLKVAMEVLLLAMVLVSPWLFGMVGPRFEFYLSLGVAALVALWGLRALVTWRFSIVACPITICMAAMFLLGILQITPLPDAALNLLSPGASTLYADLLPAERELLPGEGYTPAPGPVASTISLYPHATRIWLIRFLAVLLLFLVIRNNLGTPASLNRLAVVAVVNGCALSIFAIAQFFTTPDSSTLYWSVPSQGQVFGPFVNRNHFAMYNNLCFGLGLGLLFSRQFRLRGEPSSRSAARNHSPAMRTVLSIFQDSRTMWITVALGLMLSATLFSLSRGGFLAAVAAAVICTGVLLLGKASRRSTGMVGLAVSLALVVPLVAMLGWSTVTTRLATLSDIENLEAGRLALWENSLPLLARFPAFGCGMGGLPYIESMFLHEADDAGVGYVHAHNEYLEAWIEGGLVQLLLLVTAVAVAIRFCFRVFAKHPSRSCSGMGIGLLFCVLSISLHSIGEFGIHIPAIALLTAIITAQASGIGDLRRRQPAAQQPPAAPRRKRRRHQTARSPELASPARGGLAPVIAACCAALFCAVIFHENARIVAVARSMESVRRLQAIGDLASCQRRIEILNEVTRFAPGDADVRFELAQAHIDAYELRLPAYGISRRQRALLEADHLHPAMTQMRHARDLCPLLPLPHIRLTTYADAFADIEPQHRYLQRAKQICPADATLWYLCGVEEIENSPEEAWKSWQLSLSLSDRHLVSILHQSARRLTPEDVLKQVLPTQPETIVAAADHLFPRPTETEHVQPRREYLQQALALLDGEPGELSAEQLHAKAQIHREFGQVEPAVAAYRLALQSSELRNDWRLEYAEFLHDSGREREARRELNLLMGQPRARADARQLLDLMDAAARNTPN